MNTKDPTQAKLYIGLDIHKRSWKIHTATDLFYGKSFTCKPQSEELKKYVDKYYPEHQVSIAYEAGCCGYSSHRAFSDYGWKSLVVNPADISKTDYMLLRSIPRIGKLVACGILSEMGDLRKFKNFKQVASYVGLCPGMHQSGDSFKSTRLSVRGNRIMRSYFVEASWIALRYDSVMQSYWRTHQGKDPKRILIKVARKLLSRTFAVIKTGVPYQVGVVE